MSPVLQCRLRRQPDHLETAAPGRAISPPPQPGQRPAGPGDQPSRSEPLRPMNPSHLTGILAYLKLSYIQREHPALAEKAAREAMAYGDYLECLIEDEILERRQQTLERRLRKARFPYRKTLNQYQWCWPKKINQMAVKQLFRLKFIKDQTSVVFVGTVGLAKTHLAVALGHCACEAGHGVPYVPAIQMLNELQAA